MVAAAEYLGYSQSFILGRLSIVRVVKELFAVIVEAEGFVVGTLYLAESSGNQPGGGIGHNRGGEFAAGEYVVADAVDLGVENIEDPLVEAFVASTDKYQPLGGAEFMGVTLVETFCRQDRGRSGGAVAVDIWITALTAETTGWDGHDHTRATAERTVMRSCRVCWWYSHGYYARKPR